MIANLSMSFAMSIALGLAPNFTKFKINSPNTTKEAGWAMPLPIDINVAINSNRPSVPSANLNYKNYMKKNNVCNTEGYLGNNAWYVVNK